MSIEQYGCCCLGMALVMTEDDICCFTEAGGHAVCFASVWHGLTPSLKVHFRVAFPHSKEETRWNEQIAFATQQEDTKWTNTKAKGGAEKIRGKNAIVCPTTIQKDSLHLCAQRARSSSSAAARTPEQIPPAQRPPPLRHRRLSRVLLLLSPTIKSSVFPP